MMGTGCKVLLIIGVILAVILVIGIILSYVYCEKLQVTALGKLADTIEMQVTKDLPEGYNLDDVKAAFKDFRDYLKSDAIKGKLNSPEMQNLAAQVQTALKDRKIDKEELDKLLKAMKDIVSK